MSASAEARRTNQSRRGEFENSAGSRPGDESSIGDCGRTAVRIVVVIEAVCTAKMSSCASRRTHGAGSAVKRESVIWQELAGAEASPAELCDFEMW
jgi:hypothetical protein